MPDLPRGTVTFVFTDIEGSTELLKQLGERYREILGEHRRIVREKFAAANGIEIDTQGDAFFFVFSRAREAVASAVEVQRLHATTEWPDGVAVRVRIGLHTGEPAVDDEGYLGLDVVRAARICTVGKGGQVLLSETTRALVGSSLPDGVSVFPLGERHLRGLDEPERVYEIAIEGVETEDLAQPVVPSTRAETAKVGGGDVEKGLDDLGERIAAGVQERVLGALERSLGRVGRAHGETPGADDVDVDEIASRAAALEAKISARVEEALRARGVSRGPKPEK